MYPIPSVYSKFKAILQGRFQLDNLKFVSFLLCSIGLLVHICFLVLFCKLGVSELFVLNFFSIVLWAWAVYESGHDRTFKATLIGSTEIICHALYSTYLLGIDSGFHLYLWPLSTWMTFTQAFKYKYVIGVGIISIASLLLLYVQHYQQLSIPVYSFSHELTSTLFYSNLLTSSSLLIFTTVFVRLSFDKQKRELENLATHDQLTMLYNRHYLTAFMQQYRQKRLRDKEPYCLAMADIDHFKKINDQYGHAFGDHVLKQFSHYLKQELRANDVVARWGGEEFLIVLLNCELNEAVNRIDAIRLGISKDIKLANEDSEVINITASFGIVESVDHEPTEELVSKVDKLLYQAKQKGRNAIMTE